MAEQGNGIFSGMFSGKKDPAEQADPSAAAPEQAGQETPQSVEAEVVNPLEAKVAELEAGMNQLKDQILRKAAEFENYRKRLENDTLSRIQYANERLLENLIPVIDDFERSLKMSKGRKEFETFYQGVELIYQKLIKVVEAQGMKSYDSIGLQFNTNLHDALMQVPGKDVPPHTVIEEVEKGYRLNDRVIRHAKVIVAGEDPEASAGQSSDAAGESPSSEIGEA